MALILVVEDSPTQTYSLKKILTKYGHKVITAEDGVQGVELAKRELPDLILMDIVMPKLNGFQATRLLTKDVKTSHIPIILVTNKDQETDEIWGRRQGAKRYITKPVDEDSLMRDIHELLAAPSYPSKV